MCRRSHPAEWIWATIPVSCALAAFAQTPRPAGAELIVRGPNGHFLANTPIEITNADRDPFQPGAPPMTVTTDEHGAARFTVPVGVRRLSVNVPHIGYGTAGLTEYIADHTAKPHLPALAPYGGLDGMLPPAALKPEVVVAADSDFGDHHLTAVVDSSGHFHIADVPCGRWHVWSGTGKRRDFQTVGPITVLPGQAIRDVALVEVPKGPPPALPPGFMGPPPGPLCSLATTSL